MYPFLEHIGEDDLRQLVRRAIRGRPIHEIDGADREGLCRVLFAVYGFDLLYEKVVRRALLLTLSSDELGALALSCGLEPAHKKFDLALQITGRPWRIGATIVRRLAEAFSLPEAFLPDSSPKDEAIEPVEPFSVPPPLFDYQEELVERILNVLEGPEGASALMQLPTGAGKTRTTMEAISHFLDRRGQEGVFPSVIWLAHTEELCDQAVDSFRRTWQAKGSFEMRVARFWGGFRPKIDELEGSFVVGGYQKMVEFRKRSPKEYQQLMSFVAVLVIDEAHKALAPTIHSLVTAAKTDDGVRVIGLSATPGRGADVDLENKRLARVFGRDLLRPSSLGPDPIAELQARGILAAAKRVSVETGVRIHSESDADEDGDLAPESLAKLANDEDRNALISDIVGAQLDQQHPTLVFCCTVAHARKLAIHAALRGAESAYVDCRMRRGLRRKAVRAFRDGKIQVLFNYGVLSTGFDAPGIECVVVARPTTSIVLYSQMVGRGLRGAAVGGTREFTLVDVRDNFEAFGNIRDVYAHFDQFWN